MRASSPMGRKFVIADPATCIGCKTHGCVFHRHDVAERRGRSASYAGHYAHHLGACRMPPLRRGPVRGRVPHGVPVHRRRACGRASGQVHRLSQLRAGLPVRRVGNRNRKSCRPDRKPRPAPRLRRLPLRMTRPARAGSREEAQAHEIDRGEVRPVPRSRRRPGVRGGVSHQGAAAHPMRSSWSARGRTSARRRRESVRVVRQHELQRGSGRGE